MRADTLLQVERVTKAFDGLVALQDVSLEVRAGQIKALIGPNGAGKTTLFNLIACCLAPTAGDIVFRGRSLVGLPPHRAAELGIARTFQNVQVFPGMTVLEHVLVGLHRQARAGLLSAALHTVGLRRTEHRLREQAEALLDRLELAGWAEAPVETLPFGLLRRVELARALAVRPALLLLDEPGSGLNPTEKQAMTRLVRRLRDEGVTVFLVEHDMTMVMGLADEVAVLDHGALLCEGPPAQVQRDPRVVAAYLGEADDA
jgi:ABC-type branched-subunit amino acid transport system ATPase component